MCPRLSWVRRPESAERSTAALSVPGVVVGPTFEGPNSVGEVDEYLLDDPEDEEGRPCSG